MSAKYVCSHMWTERGEHIVVRKDKRIHGTEKKTVTTIKNYVMLSKLLVQDHGFVERLEVKILEDRKKHRKCK